MKLFNTFDRKIDEFTPLIDTQVGMYTCGPTVYREIHIGNLRTYITTDLLKRVLLAKDYSVRSVMNITDVGHFRYSQEKGRAIDPVMEEAKEFGITPLDIAKKYTDIFLKDSQKVGIIPSDDYPKASENIKEMIEVIEALIAKGFAYKTDGNVYFNVKKFKHYGKLSGNTLDKMDELLEAVRVSVETDKKDSADFALWKKAEEDRVMRWDSPWGEGVPGWHIECSVMAMKYLGTTIDVHAGGEDLIFPHHEDEIAQSEALSGKKFANFWIHTNFLLVEGEKMSRSKRNVYTVFDIEKKKFSALAFRYLTLLTHYRTKMNFTWKGLEAAQEALDKIYVLASSFTESKIGCSEYEAKFMDAVENDLNMPKAVAVMWEMLRSDFPLSAKAKSLFKMDEILGLNIKVKAEELNNIPDSINRMIAQRDELRLHKRFNAADKIRADLEKMGYIVEDEKKKTKILRKI